MESEGKKSGTLSLALAVFAVNMVIALVIFIHNQVVFGVYNPYQPFDFTKRLLVATVQNSNILIYLVLATPASILITILTRPVLRAADNPELIPLAVKRLARLPWWVLLIYMAGFLAGPSMAYIMRKEYMVEFEYIFPLSAAGGFAASIFVQFAMESLFFPLKTRWGLSVIPSDTRDPGIMARYVLAFLSFVLMVFFTMQLIGWYYIKKGPDVDTGPFALNTAVNLAVLLALGLVELLITVGSQLKMVSHMRQSLGAILSGRGDLDKSIPLVTFDELGHLASDFNRLLSYLAGVMRSVRQSADNIRAARGKVGDSAEATLSLLDEFIRELDSVAKNIDKVAARTADLSASSQALETGSTQILQAVSDQGKAVAQASASTTEMAASITSVSEIAGQSEKTIRGFITEIKRGNEDLQGSLKAISRIQASSSALSDFVRTISELAERIKILALNASIEAARAGKSGQGFAVVAKEVGKLSVESANRLKQIQDKISEIILLINEGTGFIGKTGQALEKVFSRFDATMEAMSRIATAMDEQQQGTSDIVAMAMDIEEKGRDVNRLAEDGLSKSRLMRQAAEAFTATVMDIARFSREQMEKNQALSDKNRDLVSAIADMEEAAEKLGRVVGDKA